MDSRFLTYLDCYGQRFSAPGKIRYAVGSPTAAHLALDDRPFVVKVQERGEAEHRQHDVEVGHSKGRFTVTPRELTIAAGDLIVWHSPVAATPPFAVWGESDAGSFSSLRLSKDAFYSHAFGEPGEFVWRDANGSAIKGVVRVRGVDTHERDAAESWKKELGQGAVVVIDNDRVEPTELGVVVGQTVFFAVAEAAGVSISHEATAAVR
ncbi:hypothetical protein Vau01_020870 [Virgisporangium aurantiacum]|uniref:Uncharacterized protein n=2 Tax=Virgisporangium aurantiacum TaxID=175570 RepID=A0A8J3YZG3_9ACTN|nr:hypothetical protein Vau01_020870 [Virgisporangium aurantiacum]